MKLLVISDTHGSLSNARKVIFKLQSRISGVIHLGDMVADAKALESEFELPFHYVAGNCDFYFSADESLAAKKTIVINGAKIMLTHGHSEGVKRDYSKLASLASKNGCVCALCGHTHEPFNKVIENVLILNPGSASYPRRTARYPSYGVLDVADDGGIRAGIVEIR